VVSGGTQWSLVMYSGPEWTLWSRVISDHCGPELSLGHFMDVVYSMRSGNMYVS